MSRNKTLGKWNSSLAGEVTVCERKLMHGFEFINLSYCKE